MEIIIGRDRECAAISGLIRQHKNIIIFGPAGVGKTVVINNALSGFTSLNKFYSPASRTLKESLLNLIAYDSFDKKTVREANILSLKKLFYRIIAMKRPEYIIFDHVEKVEPKYYSFFLYLIESKIPLIVLSRGLEKKDIGYLRMSSFNFEKIEISNFDKQGTDILISHFIKEFGIKVTNETDFKREIFHFSQGNPKIIKGLCFMARDVKYQKGGSVDVKLMDLDRRISEAVY